METVFRRRDMILNPRYGRVGIIGFGHILLVDVFGPIVEIFGYVLIPSFWLLGLLSLDYLWALLAVTFGFGVVISVGALALEEVELRRFPNGKSLLILMRAAVLENFGYRQINNVWRLRGLWQFMTGAQGWGSMTRTGFRSS
ncbi:hypothetical protein [Caulobacter sp. DWR2-3-1b2]|uniref:hypothetical protein n=1 Tax=unclassified Caulobacter TaxID=2648921 RepID=UPI003CF96210